MEVTYQHFYRSPYDENINIRAKNFTWFVLGAAVGSVSMYFLDPQRGRTRRAYIQQRAVGIGNDAICVVDKQVRNFGNHIWGLGAELVSFIVKSPATDDYTLVQRIRSKIGREVTHPRALHIRAENGRVFLSGKILSTEVENVVECIRRMKGVNHVVNDLEVHTSAESIPDLQGKGKPYLQDQRH
jgi:hypothetical protein